MNPKDLFTIIYYTSNHEDWSFEKKIITKLLEVSGNIPIISVSQKPLNLGKNICVGNVGANYVNLHRQIQIGCKATTTPFIIATEADCIYPPDYFNFKPKSLNKCYLYNNIYILKSWTDGFLKKDICFGALIIGRDFYLKRLETALQGKPLWGNSLADKNNRFWDRKKDWEYYGSENPVISFKTGHGVMKATKTFGTPIDNIPYWGQANALRKEMFG